MRLLSFLLLLCFVANPRLHAQTQRISVWEDRVPLKKIIYLVEQNTSFAFTYQSESVQHAVHVTVHVVNGTINDVMDQALKDLHLTYLIIGNSNIIIRPQQGAALRPMTLPMVSGRVMNDTGSLMAKDLDEAVVIGYGKTSRRFNTGSVFKVSEADIESQPVSNPLSMLQGRVPGLLVTQSNGLPGSAFKVQLRGQSSIGITPGKLPPNDPLFIIDGVPFAPNNNSLQTVGSGSALGEQGRSPFSLIDPGDIAHIEVLKDADATAIYGSRGANGVVLITTKRGKPGKPSFTVNVNKGFSNLTRFTGFLNTQQYIQMRREALQNDALTPDSENAPDLVLWDSTRYTDFEQLLIGGTAVTNNAQFSLGGSVRRLQYYLSTGYHHETTVFPGNLGDQRLSLHAYLNHTSADSNWHTALSVIYTSDKNRSILKDLTSFVTLAPNTPALYDSTGKLNWQQGGMSFSNPMALLQQLYEAKSNNLLGNLDISYRIFNHLVVKTSIGYNRLQSDEISLIPGSTQSPYATGTPQGSAYTGNLVYNSWIVEPQIEYSSILKTAKFTALLGGTLQYQSNHVGSITGTGFSSDSLLRDMSAAGKTTANKFNSDYRYAGVFTRLNYNIHDTYIFNLTGRIDGSSRFGPGKQVGAFGAAGAAWIFSNEPFFKDHVHFISFAKLRSSYGITGNDQIGDYKYLDKWLIVPNTYLGNRAVVPVQLSDSNYSWEVNRKFNAALDLWFFNDRLSISVAYYSNRTGSQLIAYTLPAITGFNSFAARNTGAVVQNTGWEMVLQTRNRINNNLQMGGSLLLTIPKNKLISFPSLETSSYASSLIVGQPLSVQKGYGYTGVNAQTGLYTFQDKNCNGVISYPADYGIIGHFDPAWYGGVQSYVQYKNWQLNMFFEVRRQKGYSYLNTIYNDNNYPGIAMVNQPVMVMDHWHKPGDMAALQKFSTGASDAVQTGIDDFAQSDGVLSDASFVRLKNIECSYKLPQQWLQRIFMKTGKVYLQAQNLFTITRYKGTDPETQNFLTLPPLRTVTVGVELGF